MGMLQGIRAVFFDLDDTIWDFRRNGEVGLRQIYSDHRLSDRGIPGEDVFVDRYMSHNAACWARYRKGELDQMTLRWMRYHLTLSEFGVDDKALAIRLSGDYLDAMSAQDILVDGARDLLDAMHEVVPLHLITNGFEEVQQRKLRVSRLGHYFQTVTTSEQADAVKPDPRIFHHALKAAGAQAAESLYIGDSPEVDGSCRNVGMNFIWFNPSGKESSREHVEISHLSQLFKVVREAGFSGTKST